MILLVSPLVLLTCSTSPLAPGMCSGYTLFVDVFMLNDLVSDNLLFRMHVAAPRATGISSGLKTPVPLGSNSWRLLKNVSESWLQTLLWLYAPSGTMAYSCKRRSMLRIRPSYWTIGRPLRCVQGGGNSPSLNCDRSLYRMSSSHVIRWCTGIPASSTALYWLRIRRHHSASVASIFYHSSFNGFTECGLGTFVALSVPDFYCQLYR